MQLSALDYHLPPEAIAHSPAEPRDSARLLVYERATRTISHHHVRDLPTLLPQGAVLVPNTTKVRKARLQATRQKNGAACELLVVAEQETTLEVVIGGASRVKNGEHFMVGDALLTCAERLDHPGLATYLVSGTPEALRIALAMGSTPLPPYIHDSSAPDARYQTVYAAGNAVSAAAPTAGLHFTSELISALTEKGVEWAPVELTVGLGTFLPLRNEVLEDNTLHPESTQVSAQSAAIITAARNEKRPVIAIGTTACRTLESHMAEDTLIADTRSTNLFIYPPYQWKCVNGLLTNFHLPKSSLLALVAAQVAQGSDLNPEEALAEVHRIYKEALEAGYRFYSFGDAMLVVEKAILS